MRRFRSLPGHSLLADFDAFFAHPEIVRAALSPAVFDSAAALRAAHGLRTPDALHVAAALASGCQAFLTNDRRLARITDQLMSVSESR